MEITLHHTQLIKTQLVILYAKKKAIQIYP
jgi:hypothetical protein